MAVKFPNGIDLQSQRAQAMADPSSGTDGATKQYVDAKVNGLAWKQAVRAATTANGALATAYENGDVIDGVTLATGDRILVKNQTTGAENGIYTVNASGAPTRAVDADGAGEIGPNTTVMVSEGTTLADTAWTVTNNGAITIGTTAIVWAQVPVGGGGGFTTAGSGLTGSGATINVGQGTGIIVNADDVAIDPSVVARKFAANVGNGALTSIAVNHNLGTRDVTVDVHDAATFEKVYPDIVKTDANNVTLTFAVAPASAAYRCVVVG